MYLFSFVAKSILVSYSLFSSYEYIFIFQLEMYLYLISYEYIVYYSYEGIRMKICVTASSSGLNAAVNPHFGRCDYFVIVNSENMDCESIENNQAAASGGAGVQAAQQVIGNDIDVLITGSVGPNAFSLLSSENVDMKLFSSGSVLEAVEAYKSGSLVSIEAANSSGKT